jgi:cyclase
MAGIVVVCVLAGLVACALAEDQPVWSVSKIADHIYELSIDGGGYPVKVIASVGPDGVLIVDSGTREASQALKAALESLGGPPRVIINTHAHIEHTAGNIALGGGALVVGHESLRRRLTRGSYLFDEFTEDALPKITFADSMTVHFNGEDIRLRAFPGAHDDGDIVIWFTGSRVACVGALCNGLHFPSVDSQGGNVLKYPETCQQVVDMLPEDVKVVPGHAEDCTLADVRRFHEMLLATTEVVRRGLAEGKDLTALQGEDVLGPWSSFEGAYVDKNAWIEYLVEAIQPPSPKPPSNAPFFDLMYHAIKDKGVDGAIAEYRRIKAEEADRYALREELVVYIPYKLDLNGRYPEALKFYDLCAAEYPAGKYASFCLNRIGDINADEGHPDLARASYEKCLKLDPANAYARKKLEELAKP